MSVSNSFFFFFFFFFSMVVCYEHVIGAVEERFNITVSSLFHTDNVCSHSKDIYPSALRVVHGNGPCSPLGPNSTLLSPLDILLQDQIRVDQLNKKSTNQSNFKPESLKIPVNSGLSLRNGNYIVTIGFGTPSADYSLAMDTGSDLTWIQCRPCGICYSQEQPIFDPSSSSSYSPVSCSSSLCDLSHSATGRNPGCSLIRPDCLYRVAYGDRSTSEGIFATETLTLTPNDVFPNFKFGCGTNNQGLFGRAAGLFGLGRNSISAATQITPRYGGAFSYCLPRTRSATGYLNFGQSYSSSETQFTTMQSRERHPTFYFVELIGISVGGQRLSISPIEVSNSGVILDSGTVITRLPPMVYAELREAFREGMSRYQLTEGVSLLDTCYDLTGLDTVMIPKIVLHFSGEANLPVDGLGAVFLFSLDKVCLAFASNLDSNDLAIIGNTQQKTLEVVYDVQGQRIGFRSGAC